MSMSVLAPERVMSDPVPQTGGILTPEELDACKRVLTLFKTRRQTLVIMEMSDIEQRTYVALWRTGYVIEVLVAPRSAFHWHETEISPEGWAWLAQVSETK